MPEFNTSSFKPPGVMNRHGGKLLGAANTALIVWLYATFATRDDLARHEARERESRCEVWRNVMDLLAVKRAETTNGLTVVLTNDSVNP